MRVDCLKKLRGRVCPPRYLFNKILELGVGIFFHSNFYYISSRQIFDLK